MTVQSSRLLALVLTPVLAALLSACAGTPDTATDNVAGVSGNAPSLPRDALAPRTLAPDECGLFVWRNTPAKPFVLFSGRTSAIWDGREIAFASDAPAAPRQEFTADGRPWTLDLGRPSPVAEGLRYDSGTLVTEEDGWEKRIPVVGLSTCI